MNSGYFAAPFSGKLSLVKSNFEDKAPIMQPAVAIAGDQAGAAAAAVPRPQELGGREGPEPTRFGDWELRGRCIDF
jgi:hypothetical protein